MNNKKLSNHVRLIAFFLTAAILICIFGFTVDGWMWDDGGETKLPGENSGALKDENEDDTVNKDEADTSFTQPSFINYLTGLETTEDISNSSALAFIMNSEDACYGISRSDLLVEIPIENNKTSIENKKKSIKQRSKQ